MKRGRVALIDADIVAYAAAAGVEERVDFGDGEDVWNVGDLDDACGIAVEEIGRITRDVGAVEVVLAMSCSRTDGWRRDIYPQYKSHRIGQRDPEHREPVKQWLREHYQVIERPRIEGDDLLGIMATKPHFDGWPMDRRVIVSVDKDLKQIPGVLFNPRKQEETRASQEEADEFHLYQTLVGDATDGYPGCPGIGPKRAPAFLAKGWPGVLEAFTSKGLTLADALVQARVARILRHGEFDYQTKQPIHWSPAQ